MMKINHPRLLETLAVIDASPGAKMKVNRARIGIQTHRFR